VTEWVKIATDEETLRDFIVRVELQNPATGDDAKLQAGTKRPLIRVVAYGEVTWSKPMQGWTAMVERTSKSQRRAEDLPTNDCLANIKPLSEQTKSNAENPTTITLRK
jgi:hypothetical protein